MPKPIKIEKGIELPPPRGRYMHWPFADLKIGESFLVPVDATQAPTYWQSRVLQASRRHKDKGQKYTTRKVDGGIRVWRTK